MFFTGIADEAGDDIQTQIKAHKELGWKHIELRNISGVSLTDLCDRNFDEVVGLDRLRIIHMNDSKREFGSRKDRHEHIGQGHIGIEAFRNVVNDSRLETVPLILETPKEDELLEDIENLKVLRSLVTTGKK